MKKKRLSLGQLKTKKLTDQQQLNTKGGYLTTNHKYIKISKVRIIEDDIDIRVPIANNSNG